MQQMHGSHNSVTVSFDMLMHIDNLAMLVHVLVTFYAFPYW